MSIIDNVKKKLTSNTDEDDYYYDDENPQDYDEDYDDYQDTHTNNVGEHFLEYEPESFTNININPKKKPKVARSSSERSRGTDFGSLRVGSNTTNNFDPEPTFLDQNDRYSDNMHSRSTSRVASQSASNRISRNNYDSAGADSSNRNAAESRHTNSYPSNTRSSNSNDAFTTDPNSMSGVLYATKPTSRATSQSSSIKIIRPSRYEDVEGIASAFKSGNTVAIVLPRNSIELSKRILDFSFGVACALDGSVDKLGVRTYVLSKKHTSLTEKDLEYLKLRGAID